MIVKLLRGISGCGKSSFIKQYEKDHYKEGEHWLICSADHFHIKNGVYDYSPKNAGQAHIQCRLRFLETMPGILKDVIYIPKDVVFVDNTNLTAWELSFYISLCEMYNITYEIVRIECDPFVAAKRTTHAVPVSTIFRMYQTLREEKLPTHWRERVILAEGT